MNPRPPRPSAILFTLILLLAITACKDKTPQPPRVIPQYTIEQFYKTTAVGGGAWSPDAQRLLYHSNATGIYNLYEVEVASGKATQLTHSTKESFYALGYIQPAGPEANTNNAGILYAADQGGNELSHIYFLHGDSARDLTPGQQERADFLAWKPGHQAFFYTSNLRDPMMMDLYKMSSADWKPQRIFENKEAMEVSDISYNEQTISLIKAVTTSENELYLRDLATGKMTPIHDPASPGTYIGSGFSLDDQHFYYLTNAGTEFMVLMDYEIATGARKQLYAAKWDIQYSYLSETGKYRVVAINEDGKNTLHLLDGNTLKELPFPAIPDGDIQAVSISDNEQWMRLSVGSSKAPIDLYAYNFASQELKQLTHSLNPEIESDNLAAAEVVRFKSFDGLEIPGIFYKPLMAGPDSLAPALVMVHGGPGGQSRMGYNALVQYLVNHGYAILAVNNRGSSGYGRSFYRMDDQNHGDKDLKDCIWGKKWLQSQAFIDSTKIGIIGGSYGGFMTMAAMTFTPQEFKVGVNFFGVTNWLRTLKSVPPYWESFKKALYAEMGDPFGPDSVRLRSISPLFHASQIQRPIMVLQGANDPRVLQVESDEIVAAARANGIPVEYIVFPDEGHGFVKKENEIKGYAQILTFLDQHLKK